MERHWITLPPAAFSRRPEERRPHILCYKTETSIVVLVIILTVGEKHWSMTWRNITVIVTLVVDDIDVRIFGEIRRVEIRGEGVFVVAHKGRVETRKDVSLCEGF